ncbi:MAG: UDP-glucose 4-epimerase GalE [Bacillota bacterium]|jgi:UDP-glucose 4-epimerase|nr:UDP-glucose 4-epimerase GalE [Bacillota bacterium]HHT90932.1 UDP-glucose 4-epimerase GalE [Bacillota bacterium]
MRIVVTGGAGYIGSHTCVELLNGGHEVIIVDNLVNSHREVIERIAQITGERPLFYEADATSDLAVDLIFSTHQPEGVIHFAGLKAVGESVQVPLAYYRNNLLSTMVVLDNCLKHGVDRFVFSSSATVYGENQVPFVETMELGHRTNPYGETKAICERMLTDVAEVNPQLAVTLLRYFNPVGAHESGLIGEAPQGVPNNLMPYLTQVAKGVLGELQVFGNDYPTPDGTGVRDYIHVVDLAEGHVLALERAEPGVSIYNLGTGKGTSVLELVEAFEKANNLKIPYTITARRAGDIAECYADVRKAREQLGWTAKRDLTEMARDAWRFEQQTGKNNS